MGLRRARGSAYLSWIGIWSEVNGGVRLVILVTKQKLKRVVPGREVQDRSPLPLIEMEMPRISRDGLIHFRQFLHVDQ